MAAVTIIMYHYVRELPFTRYPNIKGLKVSEFRNQLDQLDKTYNFVTVEQCFNAIYNESSDFPDNAVLLTFDDGYKEHFTEVFPILDSRGIQGAFFPPAQAVLEHKVLDVNKLHFILASSKDHQQLIKRVNTMLLELANDFNLEKPAFYMNTINDSNERYDSQKVVYLKRLLQRDLPLKPRSIILDKLFTEYIDVSQEAFARELYMSPKQIQCMLRNGMYIGGHGYSHKWLNTLSIEEQEFEIDKTVDFLNYVGVNIKSWVMCYPYGAYNKKTIELLKSKGCQLGLTTEINKASLNQDNAYTLARFDTNDFPKN